MIMIMIMIIIMIMIMTMTMIMTTIMIMIMTKIITLGLRPQASGLRLHVQGSGFGPQLACSFLVQM